jgi:hypothetical protein
VFSDSRSIPCFSSLPNVLKVRSCRDLPVSEHLCKGKFVLCTECVGVAVLVKVLNSIQEVVSDWLGGIPFEAPFLESTLQGSLAY